ncbi:prepilin-type N-terminal cleavage/methylation domain-containing protein [Halomonas sediminis]|uniref:Prepilin-type N-terminal cleavage/methylation domain-containing protein n=1 Tax=Vreelandella zhuhanensis TaxID=2684210 RepID=A0A7X3H410_9GAMM|nr:prepilin-type N-terminal cleavage/methylation domain-containing protein [Halomonas zhuhanensis]MWJ29035.1 prepilin-type N-terminal cleavage/methylation domain-containing protein [Halomonas zhuhanensis]
MSFYRQKGFTLVELMVAMVIGTIIVLGAGQLFLTTFQTFRQVDELSRKQETLIFAANTLVRSIRRGEIARFEIRSPDDSDWDAHTIYDTQENDHVVGGLRECGEEVLIVEDSVLSNVYIVTLCLENEETPIVFRVADRRTIINN